jgi:hypothetical protein
VTKEQIEEKIGQVAYQIATHNAMRLATEDRLRALSDTMRELTKQHAALNAPTPAQEQTDGEG